MANLKQCPNGHYYDPSIHSSCPYCSNVSSVVDRSVGMSFPSSVADYNYATGSPLGTTGPVESGPVGGATAPPSIGLSSADVGVTDMSYPGHRGGDTLPPTDFNVVTTIVRPENLEKKSSETASAKEDPQQFVVGWLVAVEGPYLGRSFELHHGYTYIGREKGDIVLKKDDAVSGEKNASILYSVKNNRFKVGAGQSTNVVYVNEEELYAGSNSDLNPYDLIEIGKSKFRFVPFCCDQFKW